MLTRSQSSVIPAENQHIVVSWFVPPGADLYAPKEAEHWWGAEVRQVRFVVGEDQPAEAILLYDSNGTGYPEASCIIRFLPDFLVEVATTTGSTKTPLMSPLTRPGSPIGVNCRLSLSQILILD